MILEKTISISIKHTNTYKDETDIPVEKLKEMNETEIKKQDENNDKLMKAVTEEIKDVMKAGDFGE